MIQCFVAKGHSTVFLIKLHILTYILWIIFLRMQMEMWIKIHTEKKYNGQIMVRVLRCIGTIIFQLLCGSTMLYFNYISTILTLNENGTMKKGMYVLMDSLTFRSLVCLSTSICTLRLSSFRAAFVMTSCSAAAVSSARSCNRALLRDWKNRKQRQAGCDAFNKLGDFFMNSFVVFIFYSFCFVRTNWSLNGKQMK